MPDDWNAEYNRERVILATAALVEEAVRRSRAQYDHRLACAQVIADVEISMGLRKKEGVQVTIDPSVLVEDARKCFRLAATAQTTPICFAVAATGWLARMVEGAHPLAVMKVERYVADVFDMTGLDGSVTVATFYIWAGASP